MTKIYLVESSASYGICHRVAFTNKKKAIAYKSYYDLKNAKEQLDETNKMFEIQISQLDYTEDVKMLKMENY